MFKCTCAPGCTGKNCETCKKNSCLPNICQNKGECVINSDGAPYCICSYGYTGKYCETCLLYNNS